MTADHGFRPVKIKARQCTYHPEADPPAPIGMYHCPRCGCMVVSRVEHGPCFAGLCPAIDDGTHDGPEIEVEVSADDAKWLAG